MTGGALRRCLDDAVAGRLGDETFLDLKEDLVADELSDTLAIGRSR
ncbi:hypothetical protein K6U06_06745 [Acidiferrimicrobium sp. IK]|nr:hypothetical protein [Acidiferrimicrobium sp. IK]MCU4184052.1 hypothetical protein [Acidiferrimicrobium sp. IK]